jgi:hypothetical protein
MRVAERWATFDCYERLIDWEAGSPPRSRGLGRRRTARRCWAPTTRSKRRRSGDGAVGYRQVLAETLAGWPPRRDCR